MEEPPSKVTKYEMESQYLEGEVMEEGQEEWLSEGVLTDDDYNPASQQTEPDPNDSNIVSQDETMNTESADDSQGQLDSSENMESNVSNIEETLNNFENSQNISESSEFPEELNAFLIRKTDGKIIGGDAPKKESDVDESVKQSDDDGNDTDDLLRVLGDGDQSSKHIRKEKIQIKSVQHGDSSDDDDDFIFAGKKGKHLNVAETVLNRATATKAEPEDDITDCSSDEASTVKEIFTFTKSKSPRNATTPQIISTTVKPGNFTITPLETKAAPPKKTIIKKVVDVSQRFSNPIKQEPIRSSKPVEVKCVSKPVEVKSVSKPVEVKSVSKPVEVKSVSKPVEVKSVSKPVEVKVVSKPVEVKSVSKPVETRRVTKLAEVKRISKPVEVKSIPKPVEVSRPPMARYQYVNKRVQRCSSLLKPQTDSGRGKDQDNHEGNTEPSKERKSNQNQGLMYPEEMDEEVPTDGESESEDEDLYSELPSSDSETEDWFTLDIRAERAGDYLPLLGDNAYQILSEEKRRVKNRQDTLKKSLSALSKSGREIADELREATKTVAELDAMLKVV